MQHIDLPPEPPHFSRRSVDDERRRARQHFSDPGNAARPFPGEFKAYRGAGVREALVLAFYGKCAYCEAPVATGPAAIEHYRPKGETVINGTKTPPGYWWLASTWSNLLPSCTDCNSERKQTFVDGRPAATAGKANQFPLADEGSRARGPGDEALEEPLLLNPYRDYPDEHLVYCPVFGPSDDPGVSGPERRFTYGEIHPRRDAAGQVSRRGEVSIEVCGLQRKPLADVRKERAERLLAALERAKTARMSRLRYPADPQYEVELRAAVEEIGEFTKPTAPFSAMCRQIADDFRSALLRRGVG